MSTARSAKLGNDELDSRANSTAGAYGRRTGTRPSRVPSPPPTGSARARLTTNRTDGNLLDCELLDNAGNVIGRVVAARPPELRRDFYDGETIAGVTYAHTDKDTREATDGSNPDETQKITPDYVDGVSLLVLVRSINGTGATAPASRTLWQDITPGRAWAVE